MIDRDTGTITFDEPPVVITADLTRDRFLAEPWAASAKDHVVNEPWHSWSLPDDCVSGEIRFGVTLFFHEQSLHSVNLFVVDEQFGTSWSDWSEDKERARADAGDAWLKMSLGRKRSFGWGSVGSHYDPKSAFASINVLYGSSGEV